MEFYSADIEMLMSGWNTLYKLLQKMQLHFEGNVLRNSQKTITKGLLFSIHSFYQPDLFW
jgi:hypothetical protein